MVKQPLYQKIIDEMSRGISNGTWKIGDKIPTVKEQCQHFGVSHITVLHAYAELERCGLIMAQGKRFVVKSNVCSRKRQLHNCLGLLIRPLWAYNPVDIYFNEINYGIQDECCVHGIQYLTPPSVRSLNYFDYANPGSEDDMERDAMAIADKVDAFLVDERLSDTFIAQLMKRTGKPCIVVNRSTTLAIDAVAPANGQMVELLCATALRYGYKKLIFGVGGLLWSQNMMQRREAIFKFLKQNRIAEEDYRIVEDTTTLTRDAALAGVDQARRELGEREKIAVISCSDTFARKVEEHFRAKGLILRQDFGVAGMDGILISGQSPALTTVKTDAEALGRLAVKVFMNRMVNETDPVKLYFPDPIFVYGETL